MKDDRMLIGELAEFFGISRKAIRLYEKKGIMKPAEVDSQNGYRYYSAQQVQQLQALLEFKSLGFSLDEIKTVIDGKMEKSLLVEVLCKKQKAWKEAADAAEYKRESLSNIIRNVQDSEAAERITKMTDEERAWLLAKMICIEELSAQRCLSEALWL